MRIHTLLVALAAWAFVSPVWAQTNPQVSTDPHAGHDMSAMSAGASGEQRSMIRMSSPANGAMLMGPPDVFSVIFVHPMVLKEVLIVDSKGQAAPVTSAPVATDDSSATVALPRLSPGTYKLTWTGVGSGSGRTMTGSIAFMVH